MHVPTMRNHSRFIMAFLSRSLQRSTESRPRPTASSSLSLVEIEIRANWSTISPISPPATMADGRPGKGVLGLSIRFTCIANEAYQVYRYSAVDHVPGAKASQRELQENSPGALTVSNTLLRHNIKSSHLTATHEQICFAASHSTK
jgi:hypothetical protein